MLIFAINHRPNLQKYCDNWFPNIELPWKEKKLTARKATANNRLRCFQNTIINNALWIGKFIWICLFIHLFILFIYFFEADRDLSDSNSAYFGFINGSDKDLNLLISNYMFVKYLSIKGKRCFKGVFILIKNTVEVK